MSFLVFIISFGERKTTELSDVLLTLVVLWMKKCRSEKHGFLKIYDQTVYEADRENVYT